MFYNWVLMNKSFWNWQFQPFSKSSTFQTLTISSTLDGLFPPESRRSKGRAVHPAVLGREKRTTPQQKLMIRIIKSSDSFLISNRKSKSSSEAVQNKERNYRQSRWGSVLVLQGKAKVLLCFVSSFLKQKIWKSINNFIKKIADPDDVFFAGKDKTCRHFLFQSPTWWARGRKRVTF